VCIAIASNCRCAHASFPMQRLTAPKLPDRGWLARFSALANLRCVKAHEAAEPVTRCNPRGYRKLRARLLSAAHAPDPTCNRRVPELGRGFGMESRGRVL